MVVETDQFIPENVVNELKKKEDILEVISLNLEEGKPYVIYAQLGTKLLARYGVVCTEKIIIDKTAPTITGAKNGDVFCGEGDKTLTVTDLYLDTVTVNGTPVTPNEQGPFVPFLQMADGERPVLGRMRILRQ